MVTFFLRRTFQTIPVMLGVILVVFLIMKLVPGDPAVLIAGEGATKESIELIRQDLGLDKPLIAQYFSYLGDVVRGDFGTSIRSHRPVLDEIMVRLPITIELAFISIAIAIIFGMFAGIVSATRPNSVADITVMIIALLGISFPSFWSGLMLIFFFSVKWQIFPVSGWGTVMHTILPSITLGAMGAAIIARMTRASMLEVIGQDYVRTARAKGLKSQVIIYKHALKNALIPVITVIGLQFGVLLGGAVIVESVFAINGLGRLIVDSIRARDLPMIQGTILTASVIFVFVNLIVDTLYRYFNKRIDLR